MLLSQCGIAQTKRFAFYDQVHTTGMDIQHVLNAVAVCTLVASSTIDHGQDIFREKT